MKTEIQKWANSVQIDEGLKALSDIKVLIERFYENGYVGDWEILKLIEEIETICIEARSIHRIENVYLKRIEILIKSFYESVGRAEESYSITTMKPDKKELLKQIEEVLNKAEIPVNYLVVSRLK